MTGQVSSRRAGGVGGRRLSRRARIPGAKIFTARVSPPQGRLTQPSHAAEGKRGSEASSIAVTDVGSDMALSDSCASGQSSESLIPGALLVLPPPRECATLLLQVRQNRPTQGLEKGTLCQHCRTSWDYMHVHRMLPYSEREQQTRYSPRYIAPIHRQARNRRLIYRLDTSQGFVLFSSSQCF